LPGALDYAQAGAIPGGLKNNRDFASSAVDAPPGIAPALEDLLYDPQTSGGLLISLPESDAAQLTHGWPIGRVTARGEKPIRLI